MSERLTLRVQRKRAEAQDICSFELVEPQARALPAFCAGAHLDVHLPGGLVRQYSLCNSASETHRYVIGVLRDPASRGGSRALCEAVAEGQLLEVGVPRNHFGLAEQAAHTVLIAGGIGITPLLCMADTLARAGRSFELHYSVRTRARLAFLDALQALPGRVALHVDDEGPGQRLDLGALLAAYRPGWHVYVCGPGSLIDAATDCAARAGWPDGAVHVERFAPPCAGVSEPGSDRPFDIELARTRKVVHVPGGMSAVQALADAGVDVPVSCEQGVCGTCLTTVLAGVVEHRDYFLTSEQRAAGDSMLPCCSRALSPTLVLDL